MFEIPADLAGTAWITWLVPVTGVELQRDR